MIKKRLSELLEFAQATDLEEVVWEKDDSSIHFRRTAVPSKLTPSGSPAPPARESDNAEPAPPLYIRSTMVGTFYRSDSADRPPFVVEGTVVASGQPVAAIEAMKIMKDVLASAPCKIMKALVANGHSVEYGQPLFEIAHEPENV